VVLVRLGGGFASACMYVGWEDSVPQSSLDQRRSGWGIGRLGWVEEGRSFASANDAQSCDEAA